MAEPKLLIMPNGANYSAADKTGEHYVYYPSQVQLTTSRECQASSLTGSIPDVGHLFPRMGSRVQFLAEDGVCVFSGNIFKADVNRDGEVSFTAYDQLRYLRGEYSGNASFKEISDIITAMLDLYAIPKGTIEKTGVKTRRYYIKCAACLDEATKLIEFAEVNSTRTREAMASVTGGGGTIWVLFHDPYEGVCFMKAENVYDLVMSRHKRESVLIGECSMATDFSLSVSIDDLFNQIVLYRTSDEFNYRLSASATNAKSVDAFGPLRYFESVDDAACRSQKMLQERADLMLKWKNHIARSFTVSAIGIPGIRAGMFINVAFPSYERILGPLSRTQRAFVSECSHTWESGTHTMDLTLNVATAELPEEGMEKETGG